MALTPAQQDFLHETAKELAAAPAVGGERGRIMERAAATLGKSKKSVYALLKSIRAGAADAKRGRTRARPVSTGSWHLLSGDFPT